jgi:hypothetical protein
MDFGFGTGSGFGMDFGFGTHCGPGLTGRSRLRRGVISQVVISTFAVGAGLGALLIAAGDQGSLGVYRGSHPLAQFGGHRRRSRRSGPGFGYALYALRKLLLGAVFISHSGTPTPCATRTREDADRMV